MSSELIKHTSDASFDADVLKSSKPVLVDYWAEWCGPCKMIAPILDEVSKDYDGRLQIAKMNVDENRDVPAKFGIRGIPTLMLFKDGQLAATKVGALSKVPIDRPSWTAIYNPAWQSSKNWRPATQEPRRRHSLPRIAPPCAQVWPLSLADSGARFQG